MGNPAGWRGLSVTGAQCLQSKLFPVGDWTKIVSPPLLETMGMALSSGPHVDIFLLKQCRGNRVSEG